MKQDTPLQSVLFQLKDDGARCELWICDGEKKEKLASGSLTPFLIHLESVQQQLAEGVNTIRLQPPTSCPISKKKSSLWFNKRTIERFVRFVSTPDVLERVSALETERIKLAEASKALVSESTSSSQAKLSFSVAGGASPDNTGTGPEHDVGGEAVQKVFPECLDVETESSKRHLMNAMDARLLILEKEQAKAFARAASAGFHADRLEDLIAFADYFGATRLRGACQSFSNLHKKMHAQAEASCMATGSSELGNHLIEKMDEEKNKWSTSVSNYGRRRVWGPPVFEVSPQQSSRSITEPGHDSRGDCASPSSDSDWDTTENCKKPIYENVIGELEGVEPATEPAAESAGESATAAEAVNNGRQGPVKDQSQQTVIRCKGIVVTSSPVQEKVLGAESDGDSQQLEELKTGPGRLRVQDAIQLFESKQKHKQNNALQRPISILQVSETIGQNVTQWAEHQQENVKQVPEWLRSSQSTPVFNPVADGSGVKDLNSSTPGKGQSPDVTKDLLDRSYNCLLKINSVVQDALFPKVPADVLPKTNSDAVPEEWEWRPLSSTPAYMVDDMFVGNRTPVAIRRQSLCTPSEYKTDSPSMKGRLYDHYQEIREAKKRELQAEREVKLAVVQDELQKRKTSSVVKGDLRFPARAQDQMQAIKTQVTRNSVVTAKQDVRLESAKIVAPLNQRGTVSRLLQLNAKQSPISSPSTTRKLSSVPKAAETTLRSSSRMVPSPPLRQHLNSSSTNATQRRTANLMSQSVIAEPTTLPRLKTRPLAGRNTTNSSSNRSVLPSTTRISHPRSDRDHLLRKSLETSVSESPKPSHLDVKQRDTQPPTPVKLVRSVDAERSPSILKYHITSPKPQANEPRQAEVPTKGRLLEFKKKDESLKNNEECIKQIVSCIRAENQSHQQQGEVEDQAGKKTSPEAVAKAEPFRFLGPASEPLGRSTSDIRYNASTSCIGRVDELKRTESFKTQLEEGSDEKLEHFKLPTQLEASSDCSRDLDEDMQIDEPLDKCVSGRSFAMVGSPALSQLRASHSLPHLELSESPRMKASKEQKQQQQKQQTLEQQKSVKDHKKRGLKQLLTFGRKSSSRTSSERNEPVVERNTLNDVKAVSSGKSVRRSLEALPKIADAATEISRSFFSTFRTKSSSDSRPRA